MAPSNNSQLIEMFGQLLGKLDGIGDVKVQLGTVVTQLGLLTDSHNELKTKVLGNGRPGLADRLRDAEDGIKDLTEWRMETEKKEQEKIEDKKARDKEMRGLRITVIGAVIIFIVTSLLNLGISYLIAQHDNVDKVVQTIMAFHR